MRITVTSVTATTIWTMFIMLCTSCPRVVLKNPSTFPPVRTLPGRGEKSRLRGNPQALGTYSLLAWTTDLNCVLTPRFP